MATCYRHPDRETGVSCSSCGRAICPDCMTPTPVGMRCPECSQQRTEVKTAATIKAGGSGEARVTYALIALNVIAFVAEVAAGSGGFSSTGSQVVRDGALNGQAVADGEYWRLITGGFLHAGLLHILFNMYFLYVLGRMLEPAVGSLRFGVLYFVSLFAGALGVMVAGVIGPEIGGWAGERLGSLDANTVGASGAVFGLMGGAVLALRARGVNPMQSGLGMVILLNLAITAILPGISIGGHVGGLVGGFACGWLLFDFGERRSNRALGLAASIGLGVACVVGSIVLAAAG